MRIRSIVPGFWKSDDISELHWHDRLLFIGLWSYVDDNGAGEARNASIVGDLFSGDLETDPGLIFDRVKKGLDVLEQKGLIERYECCGKRWLYVTNWRRHQKINNPSKFFRSHLPDRLADDNDHTRMSKSALAHESVSTGKRGTQKALGTGSTHDAANHASDAEHAAGGAREVEASSQPFTAVSDGNVPLTGRSSSDAEPVRSASGATTDGVSTGDEETRRRGDEEISSSDVADATPDDEPAGFVATKDDELLCILLLERMIANDQHPRPTKPTKAWLLAANRLHRIDGRDPATARGVLRWAKEPGNFWDPNVKSLGAFREKYDQIAAQAKRGVKAQRRSVAEQLREEQAGGDQ